MVKIKDFTLASKHRRRARAPVPYSTPAHERTALTASMRVERSFAP